MAYFDELNNIVMGAIGDYILQNQNLCKLLYYYPTEIDNNYNPYAEPDIENTSDLMFKHIFPMPKLPDVILDKQGYLAVTVTGGREVDFNTGFRQVNLCFDIIFHLDAWTIKNGFRPYSVANELDKMFNNQNVSLPNVGKSQYYGFRTKDYSTYFYGIQLIYSLYTNSNIDCSPIPIYGKTPFLGKTNMPSG